jgi:hypothetical protein
MINDPLAQYIMVDGRLFAINHVARAAAMLLDIGETCFPTAELRHKAQCLAADLTVLASAIATTEHSGEVLEEIRKMVEADIASVAQ